MNIQDSMPKPGAGEPDDVIELTLKFSPSRQVVGFKYDADKWRRWEFIAAVCAMAEKQATANFEKTEMLAVQAQMMMQQQNAEIAASLRGKKVLQA